MWQRNLLMNEDKNHQIIEYSELEGDHQKNSIIPSITTKICFIMHQKGKASKN